MAHIFSGIVLSAALLPAAPAAARTACPLHFSGGVEPTIVNPKLVPSSKALCGQAFAVLHSGRTRTPLYAAERLTRASVAAAQTYDLRDNRFHADPRLPRSDRAELRDYVRSGYDRGHMAPSGDMGTARADYESFSLANIVPQVGVLNRNSWADLEGYVRDLTTKLGTAYVVTGPLYEGSSIKALNGRVLVPTSVWKALYVPGQGAGAWIVTNTSRPSWQVVSIAALAGRTGIDPFPSLSAAMKSRIPAFPTFGAKPARRR